MGGRVRHCTVWLCSIKCAGVGHRSIVECCCIVQVYLSVVADMFTT